MTRADGEVQVVRKRTGILFKQPGPVSWHDPSSPRALDGQDGRTAQLWFEVVGASSTCRRDVSHELPAPVPSDPRYFEGGDPNTGQFTPGLLR